GTFQYFIDGVSVWTESTGITAAMRPGISDFNSNTTSIFVDWIRVNQYLDNATFESRVNDAGTAKVWGQIAWSADVPQGTTLSISVRTGNSPAVDGTWT